MPTDLVPNLLQKAIDEEQFRLQNVEIDMLLKALDEKNKKEDKWGRIFDKLLK